jgi:Trk-type K+ transport system membrane component
MTTLAVFLIIFVALFGAILFGGWLRFRLTENHLAMDTKETVMLAMGLVSTMTALLLGLLVSAASGSYNAASDRVGELSGRIINLDSTLELYGPEAAPAREAVRRATEDVVSHIWAKKADPVTRLAPRLKTGDLAFVTISNLKPKNEMQVSLKEEAIKNIYEAFEISSLFYTKSAPAVSPLLLAVVVGWLAVIFLSYSVFAPRNAMAMVAMVVSALSVFGALVLIWELDRPFDGFLPVSSEPMQIAITGVGGKDTQPSGQ